MPDNVERNARAAHDVRIKETEADNEHFDGKTTE